MTPKCYKYNDFGPRKPQDVINIMVLGNRSHQNVTIIMVSMYSAAETLEIQSILGRRSPKM